MDLFDEELQSVMGDRYDEGETPKAMPVMDRRATPNPVEKPVETVEESFLVHAKKRDWVDKAIDMLKWLIVCGSISMLLWWFEVNGLMAMEAAYPCILASAMIGTGGVVWNMRE